MSASTYQNNYRTVCDACRNVFGFWFCDTKFHVLEFRGSPTNEFYREPTRVKTKTLTNNPQWLYSAPRRTSTVTRPTATSSGAATSVHLVSATVHRPKLPSPLLPVLQSTHPSSPQIDRVYNCACSYGSVLPVLYCSFVSVFIFRRLTSTAWPKNNTSCYQGQLSTSCITFR